MMSMRGDWNASPQNVCLPRLAPLRKEGDKLLESYDCRFAAGGLFIGLPKVTTVTVDVSLLVHVCSIELLKCSVTPKSALSDFLDEWNEWFSR